MGGWLKSCVSKFWVAQNCARKFRVTILLRDPLTIPAITGILRHRETSRRFVDGAGGQPRARGVMISSYRHNQQHLSSIWRLGLKNNHSHRILFSHKAIIMMVTKQGGRCAAQCYETNWTTNTGCQALCLDSCLQDLELHVEYVHRFWILATAKSLEW